MVKECPAWAEKGYCETYEKFMIRNCRTSCMAGGYVNGKRQLSLRKQTFSKCISVDGLKVVLKPFTVRANDVVSQGVALCPKGNGGFRNQENLCLWNPEPTIYWKPESKFH